MSGSEDGHLAHSRFLAQLQRQCKTRHGNLTIFPTTPLPDSSTGEQGEVEDTDFGAVMYITAVLVFYSLGIVVMIVKYLKTERKELEEEMALESFFKGIPSKKMEHNRDAVNRVAIRAFHTLTSGAKRQDQLLVAAAQKTNPTTPDGDCSPSLLDSKSGTSLHSEDSDSSRGDVSPYVLQREPSKYLPRVSLMFRDNRANDRRRTYDNIRCKSGLAPPHHSLPSGQRSPSAASASLQENGRAGFILPLPGDNSDHSDGSVTSLTKPRSSVSGKDGACTGRQRQASKVNSVKFVDEKRPGDKPSSRGRSKGRARSSRPSHGHPRPKPAIKLYASVDDNHVLHPDTSSGGADHVPALDRGSTPGEVRVSPVEECPSPTPSQGTASGEETQGHGAGAPLGHTAGAPQGHTAGAQSQSQCPVQTLPPSKGLLVSDV
ncbi:uncharacterized protein LOC143280416 [Babylonia areolata]|uniref:uncharacterized protein LOC143280416 n=1 Tax=Babylonia areolata TaxID=304850 RepID=UPI003FD28B6F